MEATVHTQVEKQKALDAAHTYEQQLGEQKRAARAAEAAQAAAEARSVASEAARAAAEQRVGSPPRQDERSSIQSGTCISARMQMWSGSVLMAGRGLLAARSTVP
jgi:hypothetical protein